MNDPIPDDFERLLANAADEHEPTTPTQPTPSRAFPKATGVPERYREVWPFPDDAAWRAKLDRIVGRIKSGGIAVLVGPRGTGKTRIAVEAMRAATTNLFPLRYTSAMGLFLDIRATWGKSGRGTTTEAEVIEDHASRPILCIDEIQERGHTEWEDRLLTHVIDRRYGEMRPTILIANLVESALPECLGPSIYSRIQETGGVIRMDGTSHRVQA